MKSGSKVVRRNNATPPFRMACPEKVGRVVTSPNLSPIKRVKTATWSRSVNSEDFLVAEAPSRSKRRPRQHLLSELATIADVTVLQLGHVRITDGRKRNKRLAFHELARDNVKRFDTISTEIRPCSSSVKSRIPPKSSGVKRRGLPPT